MALDLRSLRISRFEDSVLRNCDPRFIKKMKEMVLAETDPVLSAGILMFFVGHAQMRKEPVMERLEQVYEAHAYFAGSPDAVRLLDPAIEFFVAYNDAWKVMYRLKETVEITAFFNFIQNTSLANIIHHFLNLDMEKYPLMRSWEELIEMFVRANAYEEKRLDVTIIDIINFYRSQDCDVQYALKHTYPYSVKMDFKNIFLDELHDLSDNELRSKVSPFSRSLVSREIERRRNAQRV